jgi:hypothetical protein
VALRTQTPLTRRYPAPHAWATCVTKPSGTSSFGTGMACAEVATVIAKAIAISLIIITSTTNQIRKSLLPPPQKASGERMKNGRRQMERCGKSPTITVQIILNSATAFDINQTSLSKWFCGRETFR